MHILVINTRMLRESLRHELCLISQNLMLFIELLNKDSLCPTGHTPRGINSTDPKTCRLFDESSPACIVSFHFGLSSRFWHLATDRGSASSLWMILKWRNKYKNRWWVWKLNPLENIRVFELFEISCLLELSLGSLSSNRYASDNSWT